MHPLHLPETYKLACAVAMGVLYGVVLYRSGLADAGKVRAALALRNGRLVMTVLLALGLGALLFYGARRLGLAEVHVRTGYLWGSLFGGVFCGVGIALCGLAPTSAVAAVGSLRFSALWAVAGMILAIPFVNVITDVLSKTVYSWHRLSCPPEPTEFFSLSDPALYVALGMCGLLALVRFTIGDKEE